MTDGRDPPTDHPPVLHDAYVSTRFRAPSERLVPLVAGLAETSGPVFGHGAVDPSDADLTRNAIRTAEPLGERIIVTGRVLDEAGYPVSHALLEIWQANAAGRYIHKHDQHDAPIDPNFTGAGRCTTDADGRYAFTTIRPGAYPWRNHANAWRPSHIHFSVFGRDFAQRLVTQMYFPGDPLLDFDPIFNSIPDPSARQRLIARFDLALTKPEHALGFGFDIVVSGGRRTPFESDPR